MGFNYIDLQQQSSVDLFEILIEPAGENPLQFYVPAKISSESTTRG
jgi:hypothetical protein